MTEISVKQTDDCLQLGRRGENGVRVLVFDVSDWLAELGPGSVDIVARRAGEETAYPVKSEQQGSTVRWIVSAADTGCSGYGAAQLIYRVGEQVAKTRTYKTYTADSLAWTDDVPGPGQNFLEQILKAGDEAKAGALTAKESERRAAQSAAQSGYMAFEINSDGHLIYKRTPNVDVKFRLEEGRLIMYA